MPLDIIIQFVERKMSVKDFQDYLYNNEELQKILSENITLSPYIGDNLYYYLISQDLDTPGGLLDSLSALEEFLEKKNIEFKKNTDALKLYSLILKIQPKWIDLPNWYMSKILKISGGKKGRELEVFLREKIKQDFKYIDRPPKWLQSPQWLYEKEVPLLFVSQTDITKIRHDTAQLYIFLDEINNKFCLIEQMV